MKYLVSALLLLTMPDFSRTAHANEAFYDCRIDNKMICGSRSDPGQETPQNDPAPDTGSNQDSDDESPR